MSVDRETTKRDRVAEKSEEARDDYDDDDDDDNDAGC